MGHAARALQGLVTMRILVAYASLHGQTRRIAEAMAQRMRERGHVPELLGLGLFGAPPRLAGYDAVVLGSPVHGMRHAVRAQRFAAQRRAELAELPAAFFSVSLAASSQDERLRSAAEQAVDRFVNATGWRPTLRACFAGALRYPLYGTLARLFIRGILSARGGEKDTSRNYEYTDWSQVEAFTDALLAAAAAPRKERTGRGDLAQELRRI